MSPVMHKSLRARIPSVIFPWAAELLCFNVAEAVNPVAPPPGTSFQDRLLDENLHVMDHEAVG